MKRIFSGMQPTGNLHLGNYLGALRNWVKLQQMCDECIFCTVDLHAVTLWQEPAALRQATREVSAAYIAAGIDAGRHVVFAQSMVPAHAQLGWLLSCVARIGWLNRMTQFKEKAGKNRENVSVGLYAYPCLMAADILLYKATHVPVGEDQKQHLELARDIALKFNNDFQRDVFPVPEPEITGEGTRVMSLRDGTKKMSKSDASDYARINMSDGADAIAQKIRKAKTDPDSLPTALAGLEGRPEAANLVGIYAALADQTREQALKDVGGLTFSDFKTRLTELAVATLGPINAEMKRLLADPGQIDAVLRQGAERAEALARPTLTEVYDAVGFLALK